jgi:hypothetical protein
VGLQVKFLSQRMNFRYGEALDGRGPEVCPAILRLLMSPCPPLAILAVFDPIRADGMRTGEGEQVVDHAEEGGVGGLGRNPAGPGFSFSEFGLQLIEGLLDVPALPVDQGDDSRREGL